MKKILALLSALCLVFLSGCGEQAKKVNPYSSTIEKTDVEPVEPAEPEGEYSASGGDYVGYDFIDDTDDLRYPVVQHVCL